MLQDAPFPSARIGLFPKPERKSWGGSTHAVEGANWVSRMSQWISDLALSPVPTVVASSHRLGLHHVAVLNERGYCCLIRLETLDGISRKEKEGRRVCVGGNRLSGRRIRRLETNDIARKEGKIL